jgi:hypothetical protein
VKAAQVNKLCSKLTPHEQAALCMEASARQDRADFDAIADSVTRVTYQGSHLDFSQRLTGLYSLAMLYGTIYWKNHTLMLMAFNLSSEDDNKEYIEIAKRFITKLASMDAALIDVCGRIKVNVDSLKTLAYCKDEPSFSDYAEAELVEQYTALFMQAVSMA